MAASTKQDNHSYTVDPYDSCKIKTSEYRAYTDDVLLQSEVFITCGSVYNFRKNVHCERAY